MTRRMWTWTALCVVFGAIFLAVGIHSRLDWHQPAGTPMVLTEGQLVGMLFGASLLSVAAVVVTTGVRRRRAAKRRRRSPIEAERTVAARRLQ
ncbi:MAG TPA: hypothetical protein VFH38_12545 [Jatrophihabitans sp.]|nr:hypothetical protein [Jatrophihabitans sp.]